jgi:hypothetical protein
MAANAAALLILSLGALALTFPAVLAAIVSLMQPPPMLYVAAALRLLIGIIFLSAAGDSRATLAVFFIGVVMVLGGIVTPFIGQGLARPILDAFLDGEIAIVRGWGIGAMTLGGFALWALKPRSEKGVAP